MAFRRLALSFPLAATVVLALALCVLPALAQGAPRPPSTTPAAQPSSDSAFAPRPAPALANSSPILGRVPVGAYPFGIAANPVTHRVYVANRDGHSVSVIDGPTNTVVATIQVDAGPWAQVAVDAKANRAYAVNNGSGSISVIDGTSNSVIATVGDGWSAPEGVAVHTGLGRVYVSHSANLLSVVDAATNTITGVLQTGASNHSVVVHENADRAYVSRTDPFFTSVMDLSTGARIAEIAASGFMALNPDTNRLYIAELNSPALTVVDTLTNSKIATIDLQGREGSPAINVKTNCVYAPNPGSGTVSVIDATANVLVGTITGLDPFVFAAAADSEAGLVYVTERNNNTVAVISAATCSADPDITPTVTPTPTATFTPTSTPTPTYTPTPIPGAIAGFAWYDANGDGGRADDEPGLYGVRVSLYRNGLMIGQQYTRGNGSYRFAALPPGQYAVRETQPGWLRYSTTPDEVVVPVLPASDAAASFGDWDGRGLYLPLIGRK